MSKTTKPTKATLEAQLDEARTKRQHLDKTMRQIQVQLRAQERQEHDRLALAMGRVALDAGLSDLAQDLDTLRGAFLELTQRATDPHQCTQWHQQGKRQAETPTTPLPWSPVAPPAAPPPVPSPVPETQPLATTGS